MTLLQQFRNNCYILSGVTLSFSIFVTIHAVKTQSLARKIGYTSIASVLGFIGYQSDRNRERLEPINHQYEEFSDQSIIFSGFEKPQLPESSAKLVQIDYSSLPFDNYHIYCINEIMASTILDKLMSHLVKSFGVTFIDFRGFNSRDILAGSGMVRTISDSERIYVISDRYLSKLMDSTREKSNVKYIVVSPENTPITKKLLDNQSLRLYQPLAIEQIGYMDIEHNRLVAVK